MMKKKMKSANESKKREKIIIINSMQSKAVSQDDRKRKGFHFRHVKINKFPVSGCSFFLSSNAIEIWNVQRKMIECRCRRCRIAGAQSTEPFVMSIKIVLKLVKCRFFFCSVSSSNKVARTNRLIECSEIRFSSLFCSNSCANHVPKLNSTSVTNRITENYFFFCTQSVCLSLYRTHKHSLNLCVFCNVTYWNQNKWKWMFLFGHRFGCYWFICCCDNKVSQKQQQQKLPI